MATLVLGIAGNAIFPGAGGFIGATIGGFIDNFLLFPALFPKKSQEGPRLGDLKFSTGHEGAPIAWILGPRNRVAGVCIWKSDLIEVQEEEEVSKGGSGQSVRTYHYFVDVAYAFGSADVYSNISEIKKIFGDSKLLYDGQPDSRFEEISIYLGDQTAPDSLIESYEGVGEVPIFKNIIYIVIKRLALADFGNRVPNVTAIIEHYPDVSVQDAAGLIFQRAGYDPSEYDVSRIPDCFKGHVVVGPQTSKDPFSSLFVGYALSAQESAGKVVLIKRGEEFEIDVDLDDLAAHQEGEDPPRILEFTDTNDFDIPAEVNVTFISTDNDLQSGTERARRLNHRSDNTLIVNPNLTLSPTEANAIAQRTLWVSESERIPVTLQLTPDYSDVQEADVLIVPIGEQEGMGEPSATRIFRIFCTQVTRGVNHVIQVSGVLSTAEVFTQTGVSQEWNGELKEIALPAETIGIVFDGPPLLGDLADKIGVYFAACNENIEDPWNGAQLHVSGNGSTYAKKGDVSAEATMGIVISMLNEGPTLVWDELNTVDVELFNGSLESCSEDECLEGRNRAAIKTSAGEWEIIGFQVVTSIGSNQYRLSKLLRGLRGTEHLVGKHQPGKQFLLLKTNTSVKFWETGITGLESEYYYKFPAVGGILSEYDATQTKISGITMRPFPACHVVGGWDEDNDFIVSWVRRGKKPNIVLAPSPLTPDEIPELYEVEFRAGGPGAPILRTVETAIPEVIYTIGEQFSDGISNPGSTPITVTIYQMSTVVGRGLGKTETFYP